MKQTQDTKLPLDIGAIHFVGIGGIGMSGIAEVLHNLGYSVCGSDINLSANVQRLQKLGIHVDIGHDAAHINAGTGVVVTSTAVKSDNPEVAAARDTGIPVIARAEMLAELMRLKSSVAVGGTHGKTTTTSLVGCVLEGGGLDPTIINGGIVNAYGTNTRLGAGDWMVVEADESDGSFTRLPATIAIITNMDYEHLDFYKSFDDVRAAFRTFVENIPFYGFAVLCLDHPEVQSLIPQLTDRKIITYGLTPQADVHATNIKSGPEGFSFDVQFNNGGQEMKHVTLPMFGRHNVQNVLSAIAIARELDIADDKIKQSLAEFKGVKRRFTKTGVVNRITVIDDYAHHPVEISAVLSAARAARHDDRNKVIAVMQPHRYSRLHGLFEEFCTCFNDADIVLVADVYEAGEEPIEGADRDHLVQGLKNHGHKNVLALTDPEHLAENIAKLASPGDIVMCLGAGSITQWANALPHQLEKILPPLPKVVERS